MTTMTTRLVRNGSCYDTADHAYRVIKHTGRSCGKAYTQWAAFSMTEIGYGGFPLTVAKANSLACLKQRLAKYVADRAAGCVWYPAMYGVYEQQ